MTINAHTGAAFTIPFQPQQLEGSNSDILQMSYDPTGKALAVGASDGSLKIYNTQVRNQGLLNK
jgi:WD40 repeat protein